MDRKFLEYLEDNLPDLEVDIDLVDAPAEGKDPEVGIVQDIGFVDSRVADKDVVVFEGLEVGGKEAAVDDYSYSYVADLSSGEVGPFELVLLQVIVALVIKY